jgi:hypothetical protein
LVQQVAGEEADAALGEGRRRGQGAAGAGGVEGVEVAEPGGEGEGGGGVALTAAGEALEVAAKEGDLGEGKGEGADLLGTQAVLEGVEVAPGGAGAGSFAAPSTALRAGPSTGPFDVAQGGLRAGSGHGGLLSVCQRMVNGSTDGRGKRRPYMRAGQAPPLRMYDRTSVRVVEWRCGTRWKNLELRTENRRGDKMQEMLQAFRKYIGDIESELATGKATEPTYYPALKGLLEALATGTTATSNPKRIECGAPDFVVGRGEVTIGYVEAKDVGKSLDAIEADARRATSTTHDGNQLRRFLQSLGNLVLTDYLEFRWYVDGERRATERLGTVGLDGKVKRDKRGMEAVGQVLADFLTQPGVVVGTPKELAVRMARLAHMIHELTVAAFGKEAEGGALHSQFTAFRQHLIPDLKPEQFADMYAQTIAYGLFAARATGNGGQKFSRQNAAYLLPKTNPFLRKLFNHIAGPELDDRIAWLVDDLAQVLGRADMAAVLEDFGKHTKQEDPVVHFYETFLKAYDPKEKKLRGVYYTPEPVVSYIVRSVDYVLRTRFGRPLGLVDPTVLILDPAVGTGTFLYDAVKLIYESLCEQGQQGAWNNYVAEKLLPRLFGFEVLMAPYAVAHLKLGLLLQELGYQFQGGERLGVYLTNTLEEAIKKSEVLFGEFIVEEGNAAAEIKKEKQIMVVLGNPPYSVSSLNRGPWIQGLVEDYKEGLKEKKLNIDDDYVKFIRFGQWRIERTGAGILAFITNHGYLDNPTFRRMRESLMNTFTDIYVLDLHGNDRKKERCPDGSPDKNVFDIQQGVAVGIFVKEAGKVGPGKVHHADLWGLRDGKYGVLAETDVAATGWKELAPSGPAYLFVPRGEGLRAEYELGWKITEIFPVNGSGLNTDRDALCFDFERAALGERMKKLFSGTYDEQFRERYGLYPSSSYDVEDRAKRFPYSEESLQRCLYRPFDERWLYYQPGFTSRPVLHVMGNMLRGANLGLVAARQSKEPFAVLSTRRICAHKIVTVYDRSSMFPLYRYPETGSEQKQLAIEEGRWPNLSPEFIADVGKRLGVWSIPDGVGDMIDTFGPEDVFYYAYAVFHSPTYRSRYAEFLKTDFPRLPLTSDKKLFAALAAKGAELVALHLMESKVLDTLITKWPVADSATVVKVRYDEKERRVWINGTQYFEGVPPEVWEFHIGGYRVCERWLKDRKGRKLSWDDVRHYQKVVVALAETIRLMGEIDAIIPGWPLE